MIGKVQLYSTYTKALAKRMGWPWPPKKPKHKKRKKVNK